MMPFNRPLVYGKELEYVKKAIMNHKLAGDGSFTKKCHDWFEEHFGCKKALLTTSCTHALEMAAILADIKAGDEVIMPSYTFVSTALAFVRAGARITFVDSHTDYPNLDEEEIEKYISPRTKAIVPVHYAGIACDMDRIMDVADRHNILVIEDAAQAIDSYYKGKPLGSIGHMAAFSFHETKNINSGEGGLLAINDDRFIRRSEIIWEKGTNRAEFFRGEVNKYGWCDTGSSFLPSEIIAAYLWAQLENINEIQKKRIALWEKYYNGLEGWADGNIKSLPVIPKYATNNGHLFYLVSRSTDQRANLINRLKENGVHAVFHYLSLHNSQYYKNLHDGRELPNADFFSENLVRLPLFFELTEDDADMIISLIKG